VWPGRNQRGTRVRACQRGAECARRSDSSVNRSGLPADAIVPRPNERPPNRRGCHFRPSAFARSGSWRRGSSRGPTGRGMEGPFSARRPVARDQADVAPASSGTDDVRAPPRPGMAFGTGLHQTTRLCLAALDDLAGERPEACPRPRCRLWLGILAMRRGEAGRRASWASIRTRSPSRRPSRRRAQRPRRADLGTPWKPAVGRGAVRRDLANLIASLLVTLARSSATSCAPGGTLLASGIFVDRESEVRDAFADGRLGRDGPDDRGRMDCSRGGPHVAIRCVNAPKPIWVDLAPPLRETSGQSRATRRDARPDRPSPWRLPRGCRQPHPGLRAPRHASVEKATNGSCTNHRWLAPLLVLGTLIALRSARPSSGAAVRGGRRRGWTARNDVSARVFTAQLGWLVLCVRPAAPAVPIRPMAERQQMQVEGRVTPGSLSSPRRRDLQRYRHHPCHREDGNRHLQDDLSNCLSSRPRVRSAGVACIAPGVWVGAFGPEVMKTGRITIWPLNERDTLHPSVSSPGV